MLNGSRTKRVGTVDRRMSVTGTTIAPGSILPTGTAGGATAAIREEGFQGDSGYRPYRDQRDYPYDRR